MIKMAWAVVALLIALVAPLPAQQPDMTVREIYAIINERDQRYSQRFDSQERAVAAALAAAKEAVVKAELQANSKFESVNEFRGQLKDQQLTLIPRTEADIKFNALAGRLATVESRQTLTTGQSEGAATLWALIGGAVVLALGVGAPILTLPRTAPADRVPGDRGFGCLL